jgi:hypothetical protein
MKKVDIFVIHSLFKDEGEFLQGGSDLIVGDMVFGFQEAIVCFESEQFDWSDERVHALTVQKGLPCFCVAEPTARAVSSSSLRFSRAATTSLQSS